MINSMLDLPGLAAYLGRIGAEPRSLRVAVVKETHGTYWVDIATVRLKKDGSVEAPEGYEPTDDEAAIIRREVMGAEWPTSVLLGKNYELPEELKDADKSDLFELRQRDGKLIMIHQRTEGKNGDKKYVPWTYWSDKKWRKAEPEGALPLFGLEKVGDNTTVFIHEGAKAARAVHDLINPRTAEERQRLAEHPWGQELAGAAHIGWIGGALSPARTDWSPLAEMGIQRAYIVADNDGPGKSAIPRIAQRLKGITCFSIEFTEMWPVSFDLADPFPDAMFKTIRGERHYVGPHFRHTMHPATWATDLVPNPSGKGKPVAVLRKEFSSLWAWIEETDTFICKEMPEINHSLNQFNGMVAPFSHVRGTAQLLQSAYKGRTARLCYRPDIDSRIVTDRTTSAINLHTPTTVRPVAGDPSPWIEFLEYLFPVERERDELKRWCATLIARPEVKMTYGVLLVSERQGMGKSTLGERILAPLVGLHNTGFPGERDIVESNFNSWVANKRLVVVGEIYTGQSFKAYNTLKSYLTDKNINVNEKFQRSYTIENWAHVIACSNSRKALRVEETDRRWFYPELSETPWDQKKWQEFHDWISSGGLGIIMHWAKNYGKYVVAGEHAPSTVSKSALIEDSKGDVLNHWVDVLAACEEKEEVVAFALHEVKEAMRKRHGKVYESPLQFKKEALKRGWGTIPDRVYIDGVLSYVVLSEKLVRELEESGADEHKKALKEAVMARIERLGDRIYAGL